MIPAALSLLLALGAQPPGPVPWDTTGTSSVAEIPESGAGYRGERRAFKKKERVLVRTGFSYLSRSDYYTNPGVSLDVSYYIDEAIGLDLFSGTAFFSALSDTAEALRRDTGLLPDSQKPLARLTTGARVAFAYGKLYLEAADSVIHMDASIALHGGVLVTDKAPNAGGDVGLAFQAALGAHFIAWVQASWFLSYEKRTTSSFASGPLGTLGAGFIF